MAQISSCPACAKQVSVPMVHPASKVRCPLCQAEYVLQAALDLVPPMLTILDLPVGATAFAPAGVATMGVGSMEHASAVEDGEEVDTEVEGKASSLDDLMDDSRADEDVFERAETSTDELSFHHGGPMPADAAAEMLSTEFGEESVAGVSAAASAAMRRKREPSMIGNLIGVIGGGVVGCGLAYFIVLWVGGPEKDFLELGPKLPKWMLPAAFNQASTAVVTPMSRHPTPADLDEVKQAAQGAGENLKLNVPELPNLPEGEEAANQVLPLATEAPESADDVAGDLANDPTSVAANAALGPKQTATFAAADVDGLLGEISSLRAALADTTALEPAARKKLKGKYYRKIYRLAEFVTFARDADAATANATALLVELGSDATQLNEIGKAFTTWMSLDPSKRGDAKGVLLAGTVEEIAKTGEMHRMRILTAGDKISVSIYAPTKPGLAQGDTVLVLGSIIPHPKESLENFTDDESTVVWHGLSVKAGE